MEARFSEEPAPVLIRGVLLHCNRGEILRSLEGWADRWGWSKGKVRRHARRLQNETRIVLKDERVTTRISIVDYDTYSRPRNADDTADGTQNDTRTKRGRHTTIQCDNGDNGKEQLQLASRADDYLGIDVARLRRDIADKTDRLWKELLRNFPARSEKTTHTFRWAVHYMVTHALLGKPECEQHLVDAIEWIRKARQRGTKNPAGRWISLVQEHTGLPRSKRQKGTR